MLKISIKNTYFLLLLMMLLITKLVSFGQVQAVEELQKPKFSRDFVISYKQLFYDQIFDFFINTKDKNLSKYKNISLDLSYQLGIQEDEQFLQKLIDLQKIANSKIEVLLATKCLPKKYLANIRLYILNKNYKSLIYDQKIDSDFIVNTIQEFCRANKIYLSLNIKELLKVSIFDSEENKEIIEDYCNLTHAFCAFKSNSKNIVNKDKLIETLKKLSIFKKSLILEFNKLENNWYGGWTDQKYELDRYISILDLFISRLLKIKSNIDEAEKFKNLSEEKQEILRDFFALEKNKNFEIVVNSTKNHDLYNYLISFRNLVSEFIQKKDKVKDDLGYKLRLSQTIADLETFIDLENGNLVNINVNIFGNRDTKCLCKIVNRLINILKKIRGDNNAQNNNGGFISKIINGDVPEFVWDLAKKIG
ncbi:hypothetical protein K9L05_02830 [Candidatus Babeliales bacterium]|nr:hypothetical protein [Candidatus Babeliales bacterium]MCF7899560.1 hypothetical protein [Candidatus Babeliales bacterium]